MSGSEQHYSRTHNNDTNGLSEVSTQKETKKGIRYYLGKVAAPVLVGATLGVGSYFAQDMLNEKQFERQKDGAVLEWQEDAREESKRLEQNIERLLNKYEGVTESFAQTVDYLYTGENAEDFLALEENIQESHQRLLWVYFGDKETGALIYSPGVLTPEDDDFDSREREWFKVAEDEGKGYSLPYRDIDTNQLIMSYAVEMPDTVVASDIEISEFAEIMNANLEIGEYVTLFSQDGTTLTHPQEDLITKNIQDIAPDLAPEFFSYVNAESTEPTIISYTFQGDEKQLVADRISNTKVYALNTIEQKELFASLERPSHNYVTDVLLGILGFGAVLGTSALLGLNKKRKKGMEQIKELIGVTKAVGAETHTFLDELEKGNLSYRIDLDNFPESIHKDAYTRYKEVIHKMNSFGETLEKQYEEKFKALEDFKQSEKEKEEIQRLTKEMEESQKDLKQKNEQNKQLIDQIETNAGHIESAFTKVKDSLESIAGATNQVSASAEEMSSSYQNSYRQIQSIKSGIESNAKLFNDLEGRLYEMTDFVKKVDDILAEQNVLSINGSIEAANSGTAGAGFRVVVSELKSLNEELVEYASGLGNYVEEINGQLPKLKTSSDEMQQQSDEIIEATEEQKGAINEVVDAITSINTDITETQSFMEESYETLIGKKEAEGNPSKSD
jgi:methyl-accepting chemotaxis protein